jgi:hypothetical protein
VTRALRRAAVVGIAAATMAVGAGTARGQTPEAAPVRLPADGRSIGFFAGVLTDNKWTEIAFSPWTVQLKDPVIVGVALAYPLGRVRSLGKGTLGFSVEWQVVRHTGYQEVWETSLPVSVRYRPAKAPLSLLDGFAFGIGPSYTSVKAPHEVARGDGNAEKSLIYWYLEVDHLIDSDDRASAFLRLHHRSDGFGLMGNGGASNGLVIGLRQTF